MAHVAAPRRLLETALATRPCGTSSTSAPARLRWDGTRSRPAASMWMHDRSCERARPRAGPRRRTTSRVSPVDAEAAGGVALGIEVDDRGRGARRGRGTPPTLTTVVVLPTPPFWLAQAMVSPTTAHAASICTHASSTPGWFDSVRPRARLTAPALSVAHRVSSPRLSGASPAMATQWPMFHVEQSRHRSRAARRPAAHAGYARA